MDIFGNFDNSKEHKVSKFNYQEYQHQDATLAGMSDLPVEKPKHNFGIYYFGFLAVMLVLVLRLFNIQVVESSYNQKLAKGNSIRPRIIAPTRGLISDSKGLPMAKNVPSFALDMIPAYLPADSTKRQQIFQTVAELTGLQTADITVMYDKDKGQNKQNLSLDPIVIKQNISREDSLILEQRVADLPGISVDKTAIRQYSAIPSFGNILGYVGVVSDQDLVNSPDLRQNDQIGKAGLESVYDSYLRGKPGIENIEVDSTGRIERVLSEKDNIDPVGGGNLVLNIDSVLQQKIVGYLQDGMNQAKVTDPGVDSAAAVVMNPKTGAVLSLVTVPSYDNNLFSGGISNQDYQKLLTDPAKPLFNRATNGTYPSGSVIKPLEAASALQAGTITENTTMVTPAAITIGQYVFPDWKDHSYETTDVKRALAESNNVFFYSVGGGFGNIQGLGVERLKKYFNLFGLGSKTGIDLPSEASGLVPDPAWKKTAQGTDWYIGDTYHEAIGQGDLLVTPLQMVSAIASIANGGTLYSPQIAKEVVGNDGTVIQSFAPRVQRSGFISANNLRIVREGMRMAVTQGSARQLDTLPFTSAGKTGTAQFLDNSKTHAWFECFAPYEDPQIAIVVLIEGGGAGNAVAVPVAENILKAFFGLQ